MIIRVRVPATTANLGPGFDALGLALDLWNEAQFTFSSAPDALRESHQIVEISGEGAGVLRCDASNLVVRSVHFLYQRAGLPMPPGLHIRCTNRIPLGSGLGSSAAAVVTGLMGANALAGSPFTVLELLGMASEIEGHPDNAGAAVLGGLVLALMEGGKVIARKIDLPPLAVAVVVPEFNLPTHAARAALPRQVSLSDAVFNLGRTAFVVEALRSGDFGLLGQVMADRLHQSYRLKLIPGAHAAMDAAVRAGAAAAALSGAGPGVVAFGPADMAPSAAAMLAAFQAAGLPARAWTLAAVSQGASIL